MFEAHLPARAAVPLSQLIREVKPDQLDAPTPCSEFDVRGLLGHLLHWGPSLEGAARKESVPPPAGDSWPGDEWSDALAAQLDRIVEAWSRPDAWTGVTRMGGPMELPASLVGGMVVGELVVHGRDLARATGHEVSWDDELLAYVLGEVARSAGQGRELGVYGPEVPVPADAPLLDRVLGLTGRDPRWTP
ncbi:MAG TPA: TIGR03086 family metal-binding protein [Pseudonocardiaceae bacterium]